MPPPPIVVDLRPCAEGSAVCTAPVTWPRRCVIISQVIGCEDRLRNDLYCVKWGAKLYSNHPANVALCAYLGQTDGRTDKLLHHLMPQGRYRQ